MKAYQVHEVDEHTWYKHFDAEQFNGERLVEAIYDSQANRYLLISEYVQRVFP